MSKIKGPTIEAVEHAICDAAIRYGATKAILFGSYARGTQTRRSDVDAIFVEDTRDRFLDRLDKYMAFFFEQLPEGPALQRLFTLGDSARLLDKMYIPTRYPNGLPDLTPSRAYGKRDADEAISAAGAIIAATADLWEGCSHDQTAV